MILIAGIGFVSGRRCLVIVWNYAIKGGTITRVTTDIEQWLDFASVSAPALEAAFQEGGVQLVIVPVDYSENARVLVDELHRHSSGA